MTKEEEGAADAKALADKATEDAKAAEEATKAAEAEKAKADAEAAARENDNLSKLEEEVEKLKKERDNYKNVALKRLGKLPSDAEFLDGENEGLSVKEQVKLALLDRELEIKQKAINDENQKLRKEVSELKLALKNRPGESMGSEGSTIVTVKDNVFSEDQIKQLEKRAKTLGLDPKGYVEKVKKNFLNHR
jgi:hypothetical protein